MLPSGSTIVGSTSASDPQGGKGKANRQVATIKGHIGISLNEGHDISSAAKMKEGIELNGGTPAM